MSPVGAGAVAGKAPLPSATTTQLGGRRGEAVGRRGRASGPSGAGPGSTAVRTGRVGGRRRPRRRRRPGGRGPSRSRVMPHIGRGSGRSRVGPSSGWTSARVRIVGPRASEAAGQARRGSRTSMPRALRHSPQTLSRGKRACSSSSTDAPARASSRAERLPAGPPPIDDHVHHGGTSRSSGRAGHRPGPARVDGHRGRRVRSAAAAGPARFRRASEDRGDEWQLST